jgi:cytidylate kinase
MIIHINGHPGVGKLTVGRILAARIGARLLDNHSIYNIALALTEFKSAAYYETLRATRTIAYRRVLELPREIPIILTNAHFRDSTWGNESWDAAIELARNRSSRLLTVILDCAHEENARRIRSEDRDLKRKPRDPTLVGGNAARRVLLDRDGDRLLRIDTTMLSAEDTAEQIARWIGTNSA